MTTLARHLLAGEAHDRLPFRPDCPVCAGAHGLADLDPRTVAGTGASALRPVAGTLSALLIAGAVAPAPAAAFRGHEVVNGDEGLSTTTNEEDDPGTAEEGSDAEAPAVTTPDAPDEATGAGVEAETPTPPETPAPAPPAAPAPTPSAAPAPAATSAPTAPPPAPAAPANATPAPAAAPAAAASAAPTSAPAAPASTAAAGASAHRAADARESAAAASAAAAGHAAAQARSAVTQSGGSPAPAPPAATAPSPPAHVAARTATASTGVTPRAATTRPIVARRTPAGRLVVGAARWHTVRPGETLWGLATALLPQGAAAGQIARQVAQLVALNADRIDSPDLIRVGQRLRLR